MRNGNGLYVEGHFLAVAFMISHKNLKELSGDELMGRR